MIAAEVEEQAQAINNLTNDSYIDRNIMRQQIYVIQKFKTGGGNPVVELKPRKIIRNNSHHQGGTEAEDMV